MFFKEQLHITDYYFLFKNKVRGIVDFAGYAPRPRTNLKVLKYKKLRRKPMILYFKQHFGTNEVIQEYPRCQKLIYIVQNISLSDPDEMI